jgi:hypothetical protein
MEIQTFTVSTVHRRDDEGLSIDIEGDVGNEAGVQYVGNSRPVARSPVAKSMLFGALCEVHDRRLSMLPSAALAYIQIPRRL